MNPGTVPKGSPSDDDYIHISISQSNNQTGDTPGGVLPCPPSDAVTSGPSNQVSTEASFPFSATPFRIYRPRLPVGYVGVSWASPTQEFPLARQLRAGLISGNMPCDYITGVGVHGTSRQ